MCLSYFKPNHLKSLAQFNPLNSYLFIVIHLTFSPFIFILIYGN